MCGLTIAVCTPRELGAALFLDVASVDDVRPFASLKLQDTACLKAAGILVREYE